MADVRDFIFNLLGRETVSGAAKKAADGIDDLGDSMKATSRDADRLDGEIKQAEKALADLATQYARTDDAAQRVDLTKAMRTQQTEIRRLIRSRDIVQDAVKAGEDAGSGFGVAMVARIGPVLARAPMGAAGGAVGGALAAVVVPMLGAAIAGAVLGGAGAGGVVGGVTLAAKDSRVQAAAKQLGETVMGDLEDAGSRFVSPTIAGLDEIRSAWGDVSDDIDGSLSAASRYVQPLARGVAGLARELGPSFRRAVEAAAPVIREISEGLPRIGDAIGDALDDISGNADEGASAVRGLIMGLETGIRTVGAFVGGLADIYRALVRAGQASAHFAEGLVGWMPGIGDLVRNNREKMDELAGALDNTGESGWTAGDRASGGIRRIGEAAAVATPQVQTFESFLAESTGRAFESEEAALRQAVAFRNLEKAAKDGADKGINPNTEAGERNMRALMDAARAANENAAQILKTTGNHELAAEATEAGRRKFLEAADAMGVEKREAINLANKLFGIPKNVKSDVKANTDPARNQVNAYKRWLASQPLNKVSTVTVRRITEEYTKRGGHREFSSGGYVDGFGAKGVDSVPAVLAPGEGVLTAQEIDSIGGPAGFDRLRAAIRGQSGGRVPALAGVGAGGGHVVHNTYQITVNVPATANKAEVGREVVEVIRAYEQRSGTRWRAA